MDTPILILNGLISRTIVTLCISGDRSIGWKDRREEF
jgi:hypothetical protein